MQASLFMITQIKFQISFIQECRDADRTIRRGRLMEGNLRLCLCPRGGDEERKQTNVGDLKSLIMILSISKMSATHFLLSSDSYLSVYKSKTLLELFS